ncbi:MAG TPA: hypothetical protein VN726_12370 [Hanamia sp.]|nr:hypothetical protein [Hanamia sp.]
MKKIFFAVIIFSIAFAACDNSNAKENKKDPLESGRGFIEASLKGNYVEAKKYILEDSTNLEYFNGLRDFNSKMTPIERENYRDANIIIDSTSKLSDSVTIISYSNTYKKVPSKLKMVRQNNEWLVDFKFSFVDSL